MGKADAPTSSERTGRRAADARDAVARRIRALATALLDRAVAATGGTGHALISRAAALERIAREVERGERTADVRTLNEAQVIFVGREGATGR